MLKTDVLKHYGGSAARVARELGITKAAVHQWGRRVPPLQAAILAILTDGALEFDPFVYLAEGYHLRTRKRAA